MIDVIGLDHLYLSVSDLATSERFYDLVLIDTLAFRKSTFALGGEPHIQYYNRLFGIVLRPARLGTAHEPYAPGLHHLCLRVDTIADVEEVARSLRAVGLDATDAHRHPEYADDYVATFLQDPDGIRLEITNYRAERRARFDHW